MSQLAPPSLIKLTDNNEWQLMKIQKEEFSKYFIKNARRPLDSIKGELISKTANFKTLNFAQNSDNFFSFKQRTQRETRQQHSSNPLLPSSQSSSFCRKMKMKLDANSLRPFSCGKQLSLAVPKYCCRSHTLVSVHTSW